MLWLCFSAMELRQLLYFVTVVDAGKLQSRRRGAGSGAAQPEQANRLAGDGSRAAAAYENGEGCDHDGRGGSASSFTRARCWTSPVSPATNCATWTRVLAGESWLECRPSRVALGLSTPLIQRFREKFPRAVITVLEGLSVALRESLIAGRLDLALLFDPAGSPQLAFQPLMRESSRLVVLPNSRLPGARRIVIACELPDGAAQCTQRDSSLARFGPRSASDQASRVLAEVGEVRTVLALVATGVGCTILPESAANALGDEALPSAAIGPPSIWNALVLCNTVGTSRDACPSDSRHGAVAAGARFPRAAGRTPKSQLSR